MDKASGVVIIPFDYEQLPEEQQRAITPICIACEFPASLRD
jgi:hypothetical protein